MARKTTKKKTSRTRTRRVHKAETPIASTLEIPPPPQGEAKEDLSVEIAKSVSWRINVALFQLKAKGEKTTKREFVEQIIRDGLDQFDQAHGGRAV